MAFSIVTPTLRSGPSLRLCLASVADQHVDLEHIVQDGGSDDGSVENLKQSARLQIHIEPDQGMYDAINRGLRRAHGEILGYLNSDEQYLPGALEKAALLFQTHPQIEVVFGNAVVVDAAGHYLWHRKMLPPMLAHTWTCPLSVLSCGMFFRRRVLEQVGAFDSRWRACGDSAFVLELLKRKTPMAVLNDFTSAFTHTGRNLSLAPHALAEANTFYATAPALWRRARPLILLHHRLRRFWGGVYFQKPFDFQIYTPESPHERVEQHVESPTARWRR